MSVPSQRPAAVAGLFYPADAERLRAEVRTLLRQAAPLGESARPIKALIVPHAGYVYSGPMAARAYAALRGQAAAIERVVMLGPAHRVPLRGLALPACEAFATPLGAVPIDADAAALLQDLPQVRDYPLAHAAEHALEVQLPFLCEALGAFRLLPLVVGDATAEQVAEVLERLWGGPETLLLISSDLSHYLRYEQAQRIDLATVEQIVALDPRLDHEQACGATPIAGLLLAARRHRLQARVLGLCNSGDTAGDRQRVVGYTAIAFEQPESLFEEDDPSLGRAAISQARAAIAQALGLTAPPVLEHPGLQPLAASFVTLKQRGQLRGCRGNLIAVEPLRDSLRRNAVASALDDPRFPPLSALEYGGVSIEVSLLSELQPLAWMDEDAAAATLQPGVDGVVLSLGSHRGVFLPQVWEQLPDPYDFLAELRRKAGLHRDAWSSELQLSRFSVRKFPQHAVSP